ncbi:Ricin-type beta-trefoil lectin domain-like [Streptomyces zhaozhouensis]|uniref:Ricin-type beta-trefoil lectin domain-like n=1 Tax=Streptomyces zhaozhouensis TaxID=1300267 RepID=A0A286DV98_9ACTN|nr:Ricin-type beta-trefoil lectin domain-like [Streptomyces zhaozhouensis]
MITTPAQGLSASAEAAAVDTDAWYVLVNRNSDKALDAADASTADGAAPRQWTRHDGANRRFSLADSDADHVRLVNRGSGKAVEVRDASTADGGSVIQYADWGGTNQQWRTIKLSSGGDGGCGSAPGLTNGTHTMQSSGTSRSFNLRVPDNYDDNHPYRLIFAFHWRGGTAQDVASGGTSGTAWSYYGQQE